MNVVVPTTMPMTLSQKESIGILLSRLQAINPSIKRIIVADSEFHSKTQGATGRFDRDGDPQVPVCFVFLDPISGLEYRQFYRPGEPTPSCPINLGPDTLFVAFTAQAELMTTLALWGIMPSRILDLDIEWLARNNEEYTKEEMKREAKNSRNSDEELSPLSLLGVCAIHGIATRDQAHKDEMRDLILRGGPWSPAEEGMILNYCAEDVYDTAALLAAFWPKIQDAYYCRDRIDGLKAALHRGRTMQGFAWMRHVGIPIDVELNDRLSKHFNSIMHDLYAEVREEFPVFADDDSFDIAPSKWKSFLESKDWLNNPLHPWPQTKGGSGKDKQGNPKPKNKQPKRDVKRTIPSMALVYPELKKLSTVLEIRSCTKLGLNFPVGCDARHRVNFWPYGTVTGRCAPSSSLYMLAGGSPAFRHLAKPREGEILIEADYSLQEVWIAAVLSGDQAMQKMLREADGYIEFGEMCGLIPRGTMKRFIAEYGREDGIKRCKKQYQVQREKLKAITLGTLYGKTVYTIAIECGITTKEAAALLRMHKRMFPQFWLWVEWQVNETLATRKIATKLGWQRYILTKKERDAHKEPGQHKKIQNSLQNFQMQAHGSEMLRLACIYGAEAGLTLCAPLHDAIFAVANAEEEAWALAKMRECMERASRDLLGVAIPIEFGVVRYPDRYVPAKKPTAILVWDKMMSALQRAEEREKAGEGKFSAAS